MSDTSTRDDAGTLAAAAIDVGRRLATAELVLDIATAAAGELDLDRILQVTLDRLGRFVRFTGGSIALVEGDDLVIRAATGPFVDEAIGQRLPRGRARSWQVVSTLEPCRIDDLHVSGDRAAGRAAGGAMRSWLAVAISRRGEGIGLLEVDSTEPAAFSASDVRLVETVAQALAGPIDLAARYAAEQRMRLVRDAFTGMVSHELRTPITTIYGMSQVLHRRHASLEDEARGAVIADIEAEADRLRRLVEDLLVLGRAEGGPIQADREPIAIVHVLRRVIGDEARRWPAHRFVTDIPPELPIVLGEEVYVEQVVRNLVSNAAKYSGTGSSVTISARAVADGVEITVADEGIGLPDGDPSRLFDLYYRDPQAARKAGGAGIGLFVCRELLAAMGGRIWAAPREPAGSEFRFTLTAESTDASNLVLPVPA